jgi:hypothetical protein
MIPLSFPIVHESVHVRRAILRAEVGSDPAVVVFETFSDAEAVGDVGGSLGMIGLEGQSAYARNVGEELLSWFLAQLLESRIKDFVNFRVVSGLARLAFSVVLVLVLVLGRSGAMVLKLYKVSW